MFWLLENFFNVTHCVIVVNPLTSHLIYHEGLPKTLTYPSCEMFFQNKLWNNEGHEVEKAYPPTGDK